MKFEDAKKDIIAYLSEQENEYFSDRNTTREAVFADTELISHLASEHLACVTRFGCERVWSVKDACDSDPGISMAKTIVDNDKIFSHSPEKKDSLEEQIQSASTRTNVSNTTLQKEAERF